MSSSWITTRPTADGGKRYRVMFRVGGRESAPRYAGSFPTKRDALARRAWVTGELAAMRVPDLSLLAEPAATLTFAEVAKRWQASRVDVRPSTTIQHRVALKRVLPIIGDVAIDKLTPADVAGVVATLTENGSKRETVRRSLVAVAMVADYAGITPNPARDKRHVKLPRFEADEMTPPAAETVEAAAHLLTVPYALGLLVLETTGCRVGELEAARIGDLDEDRRAWLVRKAVSKTARARWVEMPADVFDVVVSRLPAREDRDPAAALFDGVTADRLRMAIARACRDAGMPVFSPHDLRHRRISLWHRQGIDWATIGSRVGQRSISVTSSIYTHALLDPREVDRSPVLDRVRAVQTPVQTSPVKLPAVTGLL